MKSKTAIDEAKSYHYVQCGLNNVWLLNGFTIEDSPYGEGVSIVDIEGLHACIARTLCDKPLPLSGREFKFLRRELDLSQKRIGEILGCTDRSIRGLENKEEVAEPSNSLIRHIYLESIDPNSKYLELFESLRASDVIENAVAERLELAPDDNGSWVVARAA